MKNVEVKFPVIADLTMEVAKKYGMIQPKASTTQAVRAVFIIDPEAKIRAILYYPQSAGRNMQEIKRLVTSLQKNEAEKVATPANWQPGEDVIVPAPSSMEAVKERLGKPEENMASSARFFTFVLTLESSIDAFFACITLDLISSAI